ncbi:MAG TPA: MerR family transcriptional regulator [Streptosporangiaceae bacterium]
MTDTQTVEAVELTVDELAQRAHLPVRTIREYQTLRLLPAPRRRGRIGVYGQVHLDRLATIGRLQRRGYSLAAIKDLLQAGGAGGGLAAVLGVELGAAALDETPLRLTRAQLKSRVPGLSAAALRRARAVGLFQPERAQHVLVRSPALLALVAYAVGAGLPADGVLDLIGALRTGLDELAESVAGHVVDDVLEPLRSQGRVDAFAPVLRRGRLLLLQGLASLFADRLGEALLARAEADPLRGGALRAAIEEIRVGAVADAAGHIEHRSRA